MPARPDRTAGAVRSRAVEPGARVTAAPPRPGRSGPGIAALELSRRRLLAGSAVLTAAGAAAWWGPGPPASAAAERGEPFDDGAFFDDGFGWSDGPATR
jgi:hypothetical protein